MIPALRSQPLRLAMFGLIAALLGLGLALRLSMYDRFLPYIDYSDEVVYVASADYARGGSDQSALLEEYGLLAPLYVSFNQLVQTMYDAFKDRPYAIIAEYYHRCAWPASSSAWGWPPCCGMRAARWEAGWRACWQQRPGPSHLTSRPTTCWPCLMVCSF